MSLMESMGFKLVARVAGRELWCNGSIHISGRARCGRSYKAWRGQGSKAETLRAHGDTFFSGKVRKFGSAEAAAKAALEAWANA